MQGIECAHGFAFDTWRHIVDIAIAQHPQTRRTCNLATGIDVRRNGLILEQPGIETAAIGKSCRMPVDAKEVRELPYTPNDIEKGIRES